MESFTISLFGRFRATYNGQAIEPSDSQKAQELLCYLLVHRHRPHPREMLASLLWDHCGTVQSKTYLRKALWQLQQSLEPHGDPDTGLLLIEPEWVQINPHAKLLLDVEILEAAYQRIKGKNGWELNTDEFADIRQAVQCYKSDLLESWYHDWCLYERERLQHLYLILLDKAMDYCELHGLYEAGMEYGECILHIDRARENTHRRLMRLCYLAGDRTRALRQYERCVSALHEELGVGAADRTLMLHQLIRQDQVQPITLEQEEGLDVVTGPDLFERLTRIRDLQHMLHSVHTQIGHELDALELGLHRH